MSVARGTAICLAPGGLYPGDGGVPVRSEAVVPVQCVWCIEDTNPGFVFYPAAVTGSNGGASNDELTEFPHNKLGTCSGLIGRMTLDLKCAGARSAGNTHATCDVAGAGSRVTVRLVRHFQRKRGEMDRRDLRNTAPVLDPHLAGLPATIPESNPVVTFGSHASTLLWKNPATNCAGR